MRKMILRPKMMPKTGVHLKPSWYAFYIFCLSLRNLFQSKLTKILRTFRSFFLGSSGPNFSPLFVSRLRETHLQLCVLWPPPHTEEQELWQSEISCFCFNDYKKSKSSTLKGSYLLLSFSHALSLKRQLFWSWKPSVCFWLPKSSFM